MKLINSLSSIIIILIFSLNINSNKNNCGSVNVNNVYRLSKHHKKSDNSFTPSVSAILTECPRITKNKKPICERKIMLTMRVSRGDQLDKNEKYLILDEVFDQKRQSKAKLMSPYLIEISRGEPILMYPLEFTKQVIRCDKCNKTNTVSTDNANSTQNLNSISKKSRDAKDSISPLLSATNFVHPKRGQDSFNLQQTQSRKINREENSMRKRQKSDENNYEDDNDDEDEDDDEDDYIEDKQSNNNELSSSNIDNESHPDELTMLHNDNENDYYNNYNSNSNSNNDNERNLNKGKRFSNSNNLVNDINHFRRENEIILDKLKSKDDKLMQDIRNTIASLFVTKDKQRNQQRSSNQHEIKNQILNNNKPSDLNKSAKLKCSCNCEGQHGINDVMELDFVKELTFNNDKNDDNTNNKEINDEDIISADNNNNLPDNSFEDSKKKLFGYLNQNSKKLTQDRYVRFKPFKKSKKKKSHKKSKRPFSPLTHSKSSLVSKRFKNNEVQKLNKNSVFANPQNHNKIATNLKFTPYKNSRSDQSIIENLLNLKTKLQDGISTSKHPLKFVTNSNSYSFNEHVPSDATYVMPLSSENGRKFASPSSISFKRMPISPISSSGNKIQISDTGIDKYTGGRNGKQPTEIISLPISFRSESKIPKTYDDSNNNRGTIGTTSTQFNLNRHLSSIDNNKQTIDTDGRFRINKNLNYHYKFPNENENSNENEYCDNENKIENDDRISNENGIDGNSLLSGNSKYSNVKNDDYISKSIDKILYSNIKNINNNEYKSDERMNKNMIYKQPYKNNYNKNEQRNGYRSSLPSSSSPTFYSKNHKKNSNNDKNSFTINTVGHSGFRLHNNDELGNNKLSGVNTNKNNLNSNLVKLQGKDEHAIEGGNSNNNDYYEEYDEDEYDDVNDFRRPRINSKVPTILKKDTGEDDMYYDDENESAKISSYPVVPANLQPTYGVPLHQLFKSVQSPLDQSMKNSFGGCSSCPSQKSSSKSNSPRNLNNDRKDNDENDDSKNKLDYFLEEQRKEQEKTHFTYDADRDMNDFIKSIHWPEIANTVPFYLLSSDQITTPEKLSILRYLLVEPPSEDSVEKLENTVEQDRTYLQSHNLPLDLDLYPLPQVLHVKPRGKRSLNEVENKNTTSKNKTDNSVVKRSKNSDKFDYNYDYDGGDEDELASFITDNDVPQIFDSDTSEVVERQEKDFKRKATCKAGEKHENSIDDIWYSVFNMSAPLQFLATRVKIFRKKENSWWMIAPTVTLTSLSGIFANANLSIIFSSHIEMYNLDKPIHLNDNHKILIPKPDSTQGKLDNLIAIETNKLDFDSMNPEKEKTIKDEICEIASPPHFVKLNSDDDDGASEIFSSLSSSSSPSSSLYSAAIAAVESRLNKQIQSDAETLNYYKKQKRLNDNGIYRIGDLGYFPNDMNILEHCPNDDKHLCLNMLDDEVPAYKVRLQIPFRENAIIPQEYYKVRITNIIADATINGALHLIVNVVNEGFYSHEYAVKIEKCPIVWGAKNTVIRKMPPRIGETITYLLPLQVNNLKSRYACEVHVINTKKDLIAHRQMIVKPLARCLCIWHCSCHCFNELASSDSHGTCHELSSRKEKEAGFEEEKETSHYILSTIKLALLLVLFVFLIGLIKATIGCCYEPVDKWKYDYIQPMKTYEYASRKHRFLINSLFFLALPFVMCCYSFLTTEKDFTNSDIKWKCTVIQKVIESDNDLLSSESDEETILSLAKKQKDNEIAKIDSDATVTTTAASTAGTTAASTLASTAGSIKSQRENNKKCRSICGIPFCFNRKKKKEKEIPPCTEIERTTIIRLEESEYRMKGGTGRFSLQLSDDSDYEDYDDDDDDDDDIINLYKIDKKEEKDTKYVLDALAESRESLKMMSYEHQSEDPPNSDTLNENSHYEKAYELVRNLKEAKIVYRKFNRPVGNVNVPHGQQYTIRGYFLPVIGPGYQFITHVPLRQYWLIQDKKELVPAIPPKILCSNDFTRNYNDKMEVYGVGDLFVNQPENAPCLNVYLQNRKIHNEDDNSLGCDDNRNDNDVGGYTMRYFGKLQ